MVSRHHLARGTRLALVEQDEVLDQIEQPTKDQSQYASEQVFERIKGLWQDAKDSGR